MRVLDISDSFETASSPTAQTGHIKLADDGLAVAESVDKFLILENDSDGGYLGFRHPTNASAGFLWNEGTDGDGAQFRYTWTGTAATSKYEWRGNAVELMTLSSTGVLTLGGGLSSQSLLLDAGAGNTTSIVNSQTDALMAISGGQSITDGGNILLGHNSDDSVSLRSQTTTRIKVDGTGIGFFAATPIAKQTITGVRDSNAALANLLTALASFGLITDSTTAT